ncbi:hypothetical protein DFH09DRAFT_1081957 [Mycena vulgaris]|nr:hypothetical protein DFH09DRAFT_1081957 [Mycena vulgaris]
MAAAENHIGFVRERAPLQEVYKIDLGRPTCKMKYAYRRKLSSKHSSWGRGRERSDHEEMDLESGCTHLNPSLIRTRPIERSSRMGVNPTLDQSGAMWAHPPAGACDIDVHGQREREKTYQNRWL